MNTQSKLSRGQKLCKNCKGVNASRQRVCKHCDTPFVLKNTPIKGEIKDWRLLEKGTLIKVIQGTGPYFISKRDSEDGLAGEKICMGNTGVYKVVGLDNTGIVVYGAALKNAGYSYIYMGPSRKSNTTGTYLEPHRIKLLTKIKKRKRKNAHNNSDSNARK